jgi:hypothetical protein
MTARPSVNKSSASFNPDIRFDFLANDPENTSVAVFSEDLFSERLASEN